MTTYSSINQLANTFVETCNQGDPGAVGITADATATPPLVIYVRDKPGAPAFTQDDSQWGVYLYNQEWPAFYSVGTTFSFADTKANTNAVTDAQTAKNQFLGNKLTNIDTGAKVADIDPPQGNMTCRNSPDDKKKP